MVFFSAPKPHYRADTVNIPADGRKVDVRKLALILAVLVILPVAVFADWGIGGAAFYKSPVLLGVG